MYRKVSCTRSTDVIQSFQNPDCPKLNAGQGAIASSRDTSFGSVVTYTCPVGQEFANNKTSIVTKCMPGGSWSEDYIPNCQGK